MIKFWQNTIIFYVRLSQQKGTRFSRPAHLCQGKHIHVRYAYMQKLGSFTVSDFAPVSGQLSATSNMTPISWMNAVIDTALRALCLVSRQFNMEGGGGQNNYSCNRILWHIRLLIQKYCKILRLYENFLIAIPTKASTVLQCVSDILIITVVPRLAMSIVVPTDRRSDFLFPVMPWKGW